MSYQHKLRAELRDIRALTEDPIGRARALGVTGTDDQVLATAKDMIKAFAKNAEIVADLAENEAATDARLKAEHDLSHLVPPSGTLEDRLLEVHRDGCIPVLSVTIHGDWVFEIRAEDNFRFGGRDKSPAVALEEAQAKLSKYREDSGRRPMRPV
jgi:hypothetical protein